MIRLETPRLTLMALTVQQMRWQRDSFARLEQALGLAASGQRLEEELRPIVSRAISHMRRRPYHARWHCQWAAVLKEERRIVGSLAFKGPPDRENAVEIGYGFDSIRSITTAGWRRRRSGRWCGGRWMRRVWRR